MSRHERDHVSPQPQSIKAAILNEAGQQQRKREGTGQYKPNLYMTRQKSYRERTTYATNRFGHYADSEQTDYGQTQGGDWWSSTHHCINPPKTTPSWHRTTEYQIGTDKTATATAVPVKKSTGYITVDSVVATHVGPEDDAVRHCISLGTYLALLGEVKTKKCNPAPTRGSDANKSSFEDVTTWKRTTPQSA